MSRPESRGLPLGLPSSVDVHGRLMPRSNADTDFSMESSLPDSFSCDSAGSDNLPDSAEFDVPEPLHEEREPAEPASGSRDPAPNQGPAEPASGSRDPAPNQAVPEALNLRHWQHPRNFPRSDRALRWYRQAVLRFFCWQYRRAYMETRSVPGAMCLKYCGARRVDLAQGSSKRGILAMPCSPSVW